ncbi:MULTISPECIES: FAD binding domain-containing protein [Pseudomonas fluorescens group]|uniref:Xanthine dehydrogenase family protein subunit M n=1 Tax=Pseudomonas petroselini TaxID=2899822 RepID=A0ABS8R2G4_9PSED|nr:MULTISPECIES: xanthine dehydrogenase family protein subunit M [Pseudomonas fluorescens group]MCD7041858.1 xanthine dehydrogenase family protein subunit M [Pseudomonas petroselini]MCD7044030.1 xanthine dehydrogenase family protein subunit M [Pseudomonas petroselini]MCD7067235.1 xanthine dehydrogenase family protein subunit M [Pseudomonas petroselini]MCD7080456.1 xanthine dehydrogenase family protein subunit M [Pseudomonas petroselini]MCM2380852.1 xanthine dehydrogenase family protein subunit
MTPFDFLVPYSLDEALELLDDEDPNVRPVGGGTAVMLMMKAGVLSPTKLIGLHCIGDRYSDIAQSSDGTLEVGGLTTLAELENSLIVMQRWPLLHRTLKTLSNVRVRNVATVGGNLAHADPHMDLPPVLSAMNASVIIAGRKGFREVHADSLCTGYYETVVAKDELIVGVRVPVQRQYGHYAKITTRAAHDWPALGLAVTFDTPNNIIKDASIVVGAATDRPIRLVQTELALNGVDLSNFERIQVISEKAADEIEVMGDTHGTADYKRQLLRVTLRRVILAASKRQVQ